MEYREGIHGIAEIPLQVHDSYIQVLRHIDEISGKCRYRKQSKRSKQTKDTIPSSYIEGHMGVHCNDESPDQGQGIESCLRILKK